MQEELDPFINQAIEVTELLMKENYQLSDIGLTSKIAFDWSRSGIYLRERKSKYRRKYNGIEYVWLRLVKELRDFGLSIQSIKTLKETLLKPFNLKELITDSSEFSEQEVKKMSWDFSKAEEGLLNTNLSQLIFSTIILQSDVHLLIKKDGNCMVFEQSPISDTFSSSMIMQEPYISFPLNYVISEFMVREDLYGLHSLQNFHELSEKEQKVLELIREGDIASLTVKMQNNEIHLIETEEQIDIKDVKGKLIDYMQSGGYQEISYKTQNGKIVNMKRKTKHK